MTLPLYSQGARPPETYLRPDCFIRPLRQPQLPMGEAQVTQVLSARSHFIASSRLAIREVQHHR